MLRRLVYLFGLAFVLGFGALGLLAQPDVTVYSTYQSFETGFMIWRSDTSTIYVFGEEGRYLRFSASQYSRLPDGTIDEPAPPERGIPVLGFGKVWKNFPAARALVGWARQPELGYMIRFREVTSDHRPALMLNTPLHGDLLAYTDGAIWMYIDPTTPNQFQPTPPVFYSVPFTPAPPLINMFPATYQPFERGFMVWRADNGEIWVYYGETQGTAEAYQVDVYGGIPTDLTGRVPPGRFRPRTGFGSVWSMGDVRARLGWAVADEASFDMLLRESSEDAGFTFALNNGRVIRNQISTWSVVDGF